MSIPRNEYPRPQFEREQWVNLNGEWTYAFDWSKSGSQKGWSNAGAFDGRIIVPFCPESKLSGVGFTDYIEMMWYQRTIDIPSEWEGRKILLHFGGVDFKAVIYVDGIEAGRHTGGCSPFTVELDKFVKTGSSHNLVIQVEDDMRSGLQPFGKQAPFYKSKACSYTRTTGIWQTVWMEAVDRRAMEKCRIIPDPDNSSFSFAPVFYNAECGMTLETVISAGGKNIASKTVQAGTATVFNIEIESPELWTPSNPFLYDIQFIVRDSNGNEIDSVKSYAGLRKVHVEQGRVYLNNKPIFLRMVLDQGFYMDGLWTAPSDEALRRDIELSMEAGFNGARLHQKIFDERFHYWADKLGYLTWAEFPDWGMSFWEHFQKCNPDYMRLFRNYFAEWSVLVERDANHPSIIGWTPFNESCSPFDLEEHRRMLADVYDLTRKLDPTRPVNDTSGYLHVKTDLWTVHIYAQTVEKLEEMLEMQPVFMQFPEEEKGAWDGQPYIVDEYGGVSYIPEEDKPYADNSWGYNKEKLSRTETEERIFALTECLVKNPRVAGYCYTQLTDIEQEQNGVYKYDRSVKFDMKAIAATFSLKPDWSEF